jgi:predicted small integral membrane protein
MPDFAFNSWGLFTLGFIYGALTLSNLAIWVYKRPVYKIRTGNMSVEAPRYDEAKRLIEMGTQSYLMQEKAAAPVKTRHGATGDEEVSNAKR